MSGDEKESLLKSKLYFDLDDAVTDISIASGATETAVETAKLVGKTLANVGVFAGKFGLEMLKRAPEELAKHSKK